MMNINDLKNNDELINEIDWEMTPEEAVRLYLEWGNNWARGNYVIRSKNDVSHYFVVNTWEAEPKIFLVKRNIEDTEELAEITIPEELKDRFMDSIGYNKGVYSIEGDIKTWLKKELVH